MAEAPARRARKDPRPRVLPPKARLPRAGKTVLDARGFPVFGARQGAVQQVDWSNLAEEFDPGMFARRIQHRRWVYAMAARDNILVTLAVVDGGSTGTAFVMVTDLATGQVLAESSRPGGAGPLVSIADEPGEGMLATYRLPGTEYRIARPQGSRTTTIRVRLRRAKDSLPGLHLLPRVERIPVLRDLPTATTAPWLDVDLELEPTIAPPLTAVTRLDAGGGLVTGTVKTAAMTVTGSVTVHGSSGEPTVLSLDGGTGGMDYTNGFLPRHTAWRWAYTTGRLADGRLIGLNLVSGFSGIGDEATENCAWLEGALVPLPPAARLMFYKGDVTLPWTARTLDGSVHLQFHPAAVHRESLNLGLIRSRFIQPVGRFYGHVTVEGERIAVDGLPGVVEDQDVVW